MKSYTKIVACFCLMLSNSLYGQWNDPGNDGTGSINYSNGNVGIGTTDPSSTLDLRGYFVVGENATGYVNGDVRMYNLPGTEYGFTIRPFDSSLSGGTWNWHNDFGFSESNKYWYAEGGFRVVGGKVGIGNWDTYEYGQVEITGAHTVGNYDAQLHLHTTSKPYGMFLGSHDTKYGVISQGAHYYSGGDFRAKSDQVSGIIQSYGNIYFFSNSNLSSDATFTPSNKLTISNNGNIGIGRTGEARLDVRGEGNAHNFEHFIVRDQYNNKDFVIRGDGSVSVGYGVDAPSGFLLAVGGKAIMEEVVVQLKSNWPDYVFEPGYELNNIAELEQFIKTNKHLPGIPTAAEVEKDGVELGEMNAKLLEKVEELTLYIIELEKRIKQLEQHDND